MNRTKIEWCDSTLNAIVGCTYGCPYCYARKMNTRFKWIEDWNKPQFFPERLEKLKSKKPKIIFMNSMSDIADWKEEWIEEVFKAMKNNPQHKYLFLTKRPEKFLIEKQYICDYFNNNQNWWIGTSITGNSDKERVKELFWVTVPTINRFLSIEPLLEPLIGNEWLQYDFKIIEDRLHCFDWVIIGAETGNRKGKVVPKKEWIDSIVTECKKFGIPVFMKNSLVSIMGEENMLREFTEGLRR